jgi:hypothetical protein
MGSLSSPRVNTETKSLAILVDFYREELYKHLEPDRIYDVGQNSRIKRHAPETMDYQ